MYAALNRGKRSVVLDLKSAAGVADLRRLSAQADVLLESFRPGVLERLGFSEVLARPGRLIVCRISGFGQGGPWRDRAGHDIGYIALAGVLARNGRVPAVQLADLFGGSQNAVAAVLAALFERERTGRGRVLDVAMAQGVTGLLLPHLGEVFSGDAEVPPNILDGSRPCYRVYACRGGGAYALGALEPKFWQRFCRAVARPEWMHRGMEIGLAPLVDALFAERARAEWDTVCVRPTAAASRCWSRGSCATIRSFPTRSSGNCRARIPRWCRRTSCPARALHCTASTRRRCLPSGRKPGRPSRGERGVTKFAGQWTAVLECSGSWRL